MEVGTLRKFITVELDEVLEQLRLKPIQHEESVPASFTGVCLFCLLEIGHYNKVHDVAYRQGRVIQPNKEQLNDSRILPGRLYGVCRAHAHRLRIGGGYDVELLSETFLESEVSSATAS